MLRKAMKTKGKAIESTVYQFKEAGKRSAEEFSDTYLKLCLELGVATNGKLMEEVLIGQREEAVQSLCIGMMQD